MTQTLHYRKLPVLALFLSLLFLGGTAMAQKTWSGGATGNWNVAGNWSPAGVPGAGDNVVIGIDAAIQVDVSPTINSLTISGTSVTLISNGAGRTITIDNNGSSIASGSTLTLNGSTGFGTRSMTIAFVGAARTMTIDGVLLLPSVGDGAVYDATNSATTVNGTIRTAETGTATAPIITSTTTNLTFGSGGTYDHELATGTIPLATWNANSTLEFSRGGASNPAGITAGSTTFGKVLVTNNTVAGIAGGGAAAQILNISNGTGDDLVVNSGSTLVLAANMENVVLAAGATATIAGTLTSNSAYNTSAAGTITTVTGSFTNANAASNFGAGTNLSVAAAAIFRHGINGGITPNATWAVGSNLIISGSTNAVPTLTAGFSNLSWDCAGQTVDLALNQSLTVPGNFTVNNTGWNLLILTNNATSRTLTVTGTLNMTGSGEFEGSTGTGSATINTGNYFQSGTAQFKISNGSNTLPGAMTVSGSFNQTAGVFWVVNGNGNASLTVNGDLSVGTGTPTFLAASGAGNASVSVGGNFLFSAGTVTFKNDAGNGVMNVTGNFTQSGGNFTQRSNATGTSAITVVGNFNHTAGTYDFSSSTAASTLNVAGNFTNSGGTMEESGGGASAGNIIFNGTTSQTFTSGAIVNNTINYIVNNGATLQMAAAATQVLGAAFTLQTNATLGIRAADGIATAGAAGNIHTTARTFPVDANYLYNGTVAQTSLGSGFPTGLTGDLIVNNTAGATLSIARTIASGGTVNLLGGTFNSGAGLLNLAAGSLITRSAGAMTGTIDAASGVYNVQYTGLDKVTGPELQGGAAGVNKLGNLEISLSGTTNRVDISSPFELTNVLTFTQGRLAGILPNVLTMTETATHTGAGPNSYYLGPMRKRGTAAFVFPVGSGGGGYRPVAFSGSAAAIGTAIGTAATIEAQSLGLNPIKTFVPKTLNGTLISLTSCYYWNIELVAGGGSPIHVWGSTGTGGGAFATDFLRSCMTDALPPSFPAIDPARLVVSKHDGALGWLDLGQTAQAQSDNAWFISATTATPSFSPFTIGSTEAVLPVTFTTFSALKDGGSVKLNWETSSEQNSAYYDVERSSDGVNYGSIGKVTAAGNSATTRKYSYTDNNPAPGRNFYRLRQVDLDGLFDYSKTVSVNMSAATTVSIFPNPVQSDVTIEYPRVGRGANYKVIGVDGRVMLSGSLQENSSQQRINMTTLQRGNYILLIQNDGQQYQQKIVKL